MISFSTFTETTTARYYIIRLSGEKLKFWLEKHKIIKWCDQEFGSNAPVTKWEDDCFYLKFTELPCRQRFFKHWLK